MRYSLKLQCPLHRLKGKWNIFNATEQKASSFEKQNNEYILGHLGLLEPHSDSEMRREPKDKRRRVCSYNHIPLTRKNHFPRFLSLHREHTPPHPFHLIVLLRDRCLRASWKPALHGTGRSLSAHSMTLSTAGCLLCA